MVLPTQPLVRSHEQDFGTQLARNAELVDRQAVEIRVGKLLGLVFVDDKETAPGPRGVFFGNGETLLLERSSYLLEEGLLLRVDDGHGVRWK